MKSPKITKLWEDFTFSDLLPFSQEFQLLEILTNIENYQLQNLGLRLLLLYRKLSNEFNMISNNEIYISLQL